MGWGPPSSRPGSSHQSESNDMSTPSNPFADMMAPPKGAPPAQPGNPETPNPFADMMVSAHPAGEAPAQDAAQPMTSEASDSGNPFADMMVAPKPLEGKAAEMPEAEEDEPAYERAWDWANTPLVTLNPEHRGGFVGGAEDLVSGFTTPLNAALALASFGGDAIVGPLAKAVGLDKAPIAAATVRKLVALGEGAFQVDQLIDAAKTSVKMGTALSEGDYETAKSEGLKALAGFTGVALAAKQAHVLEHELPKALRAAGGEERTPVQQLLDDHDAKRFQLFGNRQKLERFLTEKIDAAAQSVPGMKREEFERAFFYRMEHPEDASIDGAIRALRNPEPGSPLERGRQEELLKDYQNARSLSENKPVMDLAQRLRENLDKIRKDALDRGLEVGYVEDYITHRWKRKMPTFEAENLARLKTGNFELKPGEMRARVFQKAVDGELLGYELASHNVGALVARENYNLKLAIQNRAVLDNLLGTDLAIGDKTVPAAVLQGSARVVADDKERNILIDPKRIQGSKARPIPPDELHNYMGVENHHFHKWTYLTSVPNELEKAVNSAMQGDVTIHKAIVHEVLNRMQLEAENPALTTELSQALQRIGTAESVLEDAPVALHSTINEEVLDRLEAEKLNPVFKNAAVKSFQRIGSEAKSAAFFISPLHIIREGMNAMMLGRNPFVKRLVDFEGDPLVWDAIRHGAAFASRHPDLNTISVLEGEGTTHGSLVSKIPLIGRASTEMHDFLWEYTNTLKLEAYKNSIGRFKRMYPEETMGMAKQRAAQHVNDVFGVQPWARMGLNRNWRRAASMVVLAPDWFLTQLRVASTALTPQGSAMRMDMAKMATGIYLMSRLVNTLVSGNPRWDVPMGMALPNGRVFSMRTTPEDLLKMAQSPRQNFVNRMSPGGTRQLYTLLTGRDTLDRRMTPTEETWEILKQLGPEWMEDLWPDSNNDLDAAASERLLRSGERLIGRDTKNRSWAEQVAMKYAFVHRNEEPLTGAQLKAHVLRMQVLEGLRNNNPAASAEFDNLPVKDKKAVLSAYRSTPLQSYFRELPFEESFDVWQAATPKERESIERNMRQKLIHWRQAGSPGPKGMVKEVSEWFPQ